MEENIIKVRKVGDVTTIAKPSNAIKVVNNGGRNIFIAKRTSACDLGTNQHDEKRRIINENIDQPCQTHASRNITIIAHQYEVANSKGGNDGRTNDNGITVH